jgi:beta-galactosidase beta subunit
MLEGRAHLERTIGDEAIFVSESPHGLLVNISAGESQIRKIFFDWSIRI